MAGVAQGVITGIRSLCYGLGPALFGFVFYLFNVDVGKTDVVIAKPLSRNVSVHQPVIDTPNQVIIVTLAHMRICSLVLV